MTQRTKPGGVSLSGKTRLTYRDLIGRIEGIEHLFRNARQEIETGLEELSRLKMDVDRLAIEQDVRAAATDRPV